MNVRSAFGMSFLPRYRAGPVNLGVHAKGGARTLDENAFERDGACDAQDGNEAGLQVFREQRFHKRCKRRIHPVRCSINQP